MNEAAVEIGGSFIYNAEWMLKSQSSLQMNQLHQLSELLILMMRKKLHPHVRIQFLRTDKKEFEPICRVMEDILVKKVVASSGLVTSPCACHFSTWLDSRHGV